MLLWQHLPTSSIYYNVGIFLNPEGLVTKEVKGFLLYIELPIW